MEIEADYWIDQRFIQIQIYLKNRIRCHVTLVVNVSMEEIKTKDALQRYDRDPSDTLENYYDEICGFAYMLLITGKANDALRSWANIQD